MEGDRRSRSLLVLDGAVERDVLDALVDAAAPLPFEPQDLGRGHLRRRSRAAMTAADLADRLWERVATHLPAPADWFDGDNPAPQLDPRIERWRWSSLSPWLRWYRYELGAEFRPHTDEPWHPHPTRRSLLTLLVFLPCGGCIGGETVVGTEVVAAAEGRVVAFDHRLLHAGRPVEQGAKLVLRTDVVAVAG